MKASFSLGNQTVLCTDSVVRHDFTFTAAFSFLVDVSWNKKVNDSARPARPVAQRRCRWTLMDSAASSHGRQIALAYRGS
jgi:predicted 3-demethylubiquinone-9 3-methyltransferase (glyoxalase superfamily)